MVMPVIVNRAPVLTLWAAVVAEHLGHPADTALTLGRAVTSAARVKKAHRLRGLGRHERQRRKPTIRCAASRPAAAAPVAGPPRRVAAALRRKRL